MMKKLHAITRTGFGLILLVSALTVQASTRLVDTPWLVSQLRAADLILIDMSDSLQYSRFHLPGAINLPYEYLIQPIRGVSLSIGQARMVELLGQLGVTADKQVVIYDDTGGLHAARLYWELEQMGHARLALLDGGLVKWIREGRPVTGEPPAIKPATYRPARTGTPALASLEDVRQANDRKTRLLDVRTEEEYIGNPQQKRSGHIPGARWWPWDQALDTGNGFTLQNRDALHQALRQAGIDNPQDDVIVYCQSGHRAAHTYFLLRELGFDKVRLYDGSMQEYARQPTLPLKTGKQP